MKYYAIQNRRTKKFVTGTEFNYAGNRQIYNTEFHAPLLYPYNEWGYLRLKSDKIHRNISDKKFRVVVLELKGVE